MNYKTIAGQVILFAACVAAWETATNVALNTTHRWIEATILLLFALGFAVLCIGITDDKDEEIKEIKAELAGHKRFCLLALPDWEMLQNTLKFLAERVFATERELQLKQGQAAAQSEVHSLETLRAWQIGRFEELTALANKVTPYRVSLRLNDYR